MIHQGIARHSNVLMLPINNQTFKPVRRRVSSANECKFRSVTFVYLNPFLMPGSGGRLPSSSHCPVISSSFSFCSSFLYSVLLHGFNSAKLVRVLSTPNQHTRSVLTQRSIQPSGLLKVLYTLLLSRPVHICL